jgi:ATP-dependent Clp protease, protease subunit
MSSRIPIHTVAMGAAMSAGFIIFLAGHKRWVFNHSQLLVHQGSAAFEGTASEIEQAQKNYKKQLDEMKAYILNRCEIPEKIFTKNKMKDWYLSVEEITAYKIADVIENLDEVFE